ncbi:MULTISPECIES: phage head completion protein [Campylobacter]|uniref:Head-tail adaptor protein n=1 Tax=Campylobacter aviculae TaxID=2510190 RepID=A0A4U7BQ01_9BACT|nr:head-tail adaptor protein [Campylobacter aviculae]MBZ7938652.1 head-tail adaptor protein [Campylobacter sp. W0014]TKX32385.1 head-tail adaptor protein [Campylobacter aviculae]HEG0602787.1 head-tail adaptor protein [Campylobacter jejuni]
MKANTFKHRIKIYKKEQSKNEFNELDFTQELLFKEVYASCKNLSVESKNLDDGVSQIATHEFELRFLELDFSYFIVFREKKYEILSIQDTDQNKQFLKIKARLQ